MARIRTIKPEFFESESVASLPYRARLTWIGLWTQCDDHGRARANPKLIKAAVWPLDTVSMKDIESDLQSLCEAGLITQYWADNRQFLVITNWEEHQAASYRRGESKYPSPPAQTSDTCEYVQESAERTSSRAGREGKGREGKATAAAPEFDAFWNSYPKKIGKGNARSGWAGALKKADAATITAAALKFAEWHRREGTDPQFIPHPSTWLNGERWADEQAKAPKAVDRQTAAQLESPPDGLTDTEYAAWLAARRSA